MSMSSEFREFALKGNVVDLAVGVIISTSAVEVSSQAVAPVSTSWADAHAGQITAASATRALIVLFTFAPR